MGVCSMHGEPDVSVKLENGKLQERRLGYEAIVCTCNRPEALRMSIPCLLKQTRMPARVIVVDSSDDSSSARAIIDELASGAECELTLIHTARGLTFQRNRGLELVKSEVVFFPDDDALCDPEYGERIMEVYERDRDELIGCIVGTPWTKLRDGNSVETTFRMRPSDRFRQMIAGRRRRIERVLVLDPLISVGSELRARWPEASWLPEVDAQLTNWIRGFRMTFRTSSVRAVGGFDETLRNYATFEDIHTGFAVAENQIVVQAMEAGVVHHQAPGGRGSGRVRGATNIANRAYVVASHSARGSEHRRLTVRYSIFRCLLYGFGGLWSPYHRESFGGAFAVLRRLRPLLLAPPEHATQAYVSLLRRSGVDFA
jgi:glycosyltransferase involved in cell wall biosynthesis